MVNPLVIAYHLIWTAYGWWLPNDPRGSGSYVIRNDILTDLGTLHHGRKQIQPASREVREFYQRAAALLKHPLLTFDELARAVIADAVAQTIEEQKYTCYACAIMPDHVHLLIRKHKHQAEDMIDHIKDSSRLRLSAQDARFLDHPIWAAGHGWKVFLDHPDENRRTIRYIEQNPEKIGLPIQRWSFVKAYDGWPLHPGHSQRSPYVKALRAVGRYP